MLKRITAVVLSVFLMVISINFVFLLQANAKPLYFTAGKRAVTTLNDKKCMEGEVIVKYKSNVSSSEISRIMDMFEADQIKKLAKGKLTLLKLKDSEAVSRFMDYSKKNSLITYASPNYIYKFPKVKFDNKKTKYLGGVQTAGLPDVNDPLIDKQWYHQTINLYDAWEVTKGAGSVKVAVIDSGLDTTHPEFSGQVYDSKDFGQIPYKDDYTEDFVGHGTHVAGIIAAKANNKTGISGTAPEVKLIIADISFDDEEYYGYFTEDAVIDAIYWSADRGARIINMSIGTSVYVENPLLKDAIAYAAGKGVIVVCAAGNDAVDIPVYPSDDENAVSVIAVNSNGKVAGYSNYGIEKDISAPGGINVYTGKRILSTVPMDFPAEYNDSKIQGYDYYEGTSMAAPVVCGVFALLFSEYPELNAAQAKDIIYSTAKDIEEQGGFDIYSGYGLIDAASAMEKAQTLFGKVSDINVAPGAPKIGVDSSAGITFDTDRDGFLTVKITKNGNAIKTLWTDEQKPAGSQSVSWDFTDAAGNELTELGGYCVSVSFKTAFSGGYISNPVTKEFTLDAVEMNIENGARTPDAAIQTKSGFIISADISLKGELKANIFRGDALIRQLSSGVKEPADSPVLLVWDQKDKNGEYVSAGTYTIKIYGRDKYGRETSDTQLPDIEITPDTVDPFLFDKGGDASFTNTGNTSYKRNISVSEPALITAKIKNSSGNTVRVLNMNIPEEDKDYGLLWDCRQENGLFVRQDKYTFEITAKDLIGNPSEEKTFDVNLADATSLSISGYLSDKSVITRVNKLTINYNISEKAKTYIKVYSSSNSLVKNVLNGTIKNKGANTAAWDLKKSSGAYVKTGVYYIRIYGDNGNGKGSNLLQLSVNVTTDNKKPRVQFKSGSSITFKNYGSAVSIGFKVNEDASMAALEIVNSSGKTVCKKSMTDKLKADKYYYFKWNGKNTAGIYQNTGTYYAKIYAKDIAGNKSSTVKKKLRLIDRTKPELIVPNEAFINLATAEPAYIAFSLSEPCRVTAKVYDYYGNYIKSIVSSKTYKNGTHTIKFNGRDRYGKLIPPYLYRLKVKFTARDLSGNYSGNKYTYIDYYYDDDDN